VQSGQEGLIGVSTGLLLTYSGKKRSPVLPEEVIKRGTGGSTYDTTSPKRAMAEHKTGSRAQLDSLGSVLPLCSSEILRRATTPKKSWRGHGEGSKKSLGIVLG